MVLWRHIFGNRSRRRRGHASSQLTGRVWWRRLFVSSFVSHLSYTVLENLFIVEFEFRFPDGCFKQSRLSCHFERNMTVVHLFFSPLSRVVLFFFSTHCLLFSASLINLLFFPFAFVLFEGFCDGLSNLLLYWKNSNAKSKAHHQSQWRDKSREEQERRGSLAEVK